MRALVILGIGGVQQSLVECRLTSDLRNASQIVATLSGELVRVLGESGAEVLLPAEQGASNKIVALLDTPAPAAVERQLRERARDWWAGRVRALYPKSPVAVEDSGAPPLVVSVVTREGGESAQAWWQRATDTFAAAKTAKPVPGGVSWSGRAVCALSPRWAVASSAPTLTTVRRHERDQLSQAAWVRRAWHRLPDTTSAGFPSTRAIAAAPFLTRHAERMPLAAVEELARVVKQVWPAIESPVPGVPEGAVARVAGWLSESAWEPGALARRTGMSAADAAAPAQRGLAALRRLRRELDGDGGPGAYVALVAQDVDGAGTHLRNASFPDDHRTMGGELTELGARQAGQCAQQQGCVIYAGGDDLLALAPASAALALARELHDDALRALRGPQWSGQATVSSAVVYFHPSFPLSLAVSRCRDALHQAKSVHARGRDKHGLSVVVLRRGGERACSLLPWQLENADTREDSRLDAATALLEVAAAAPAGALAHEVERDRHVLDDLARIPDGGNRSVREVLARLTHRHSRGDAVLGKLVYRLARHEQSGDTLQSLQAVPSLLVARFLASAAVTGLWTA
ncbi:hypothetical protein AB0L41_39410 [Amycolatopsis mediterranei]|uniref:Cas10/Cmr2 second palm domain-containing protein n=1 Tax=Amycolatopsis mediterranei TaxID=33910 RepID=UPI0034206C9B